jgi:hypothetical protein
MRPPSALLTILAAVILWNPESAFTQFDRAADSSGPMNQLKRQYDVVVRAGDDKKGEDLYNAIGPFIKTAEDLLIFLEKTPTSLKKADGLAYLADKASQFYGTALTVRQKGVELQGKLGVRGVDFSSEYSNLKSAFSEYQSRSEDFSKLIFPAGRAMAIAISSDMFGTFERGLDAESPMADFKKGYDQIVRAYENDKNGDAIYNLLPPTTVFLNKTYGLTEKIPATLKNAEGISNMAERAERFNAAILRLRERSNSLYEKVKVRGADFGSEYSNYRDAYSDYQTRGNELRNYLFPATQAIKEACAACLKN